MLDDGRIKLPEEWKGWSFQGDYLIDDAHNKYNINDIRSLFYERQLHNSLMGNKFDIVCLKQELEKKIRDLNSHIVIQLVNDDKTVRELKFNIS